MLPGNAHYAPGENSLNLNTSNIEIDMPFFPSNEAKRCVMRVRYNISTTDYDPFNTFSDSDGDE